MTKLDNNSSEFDNIPTLDICATKCIFISDIHFGVRQNSEEWQENQKDYFYNWFIPIITEYKKSLSKDDKAIVFVLGDVYDDRKSIDINVSNMSIDIFQDIAKILPVYIINGNHDLSKKTNKGNTSLRTMDLIKGVTVIQDPTFINIISPIDKKSIIQNIIAIPFLGDTTKESKYLANYTNKAGIALMHTEIAKMKMDNGMSIVNGANPDAFNGLIISGHIHHRQENGRVLYIGCPYQMTRGDIGNMKGLYIFDLKDLSYKFKENDYSPIFHKITIEDLLLLNAQNRADFLNNNYNFVLINEENIAKFKKKVDIYNLQQGSTAKCVRLLVIRKNTNILDGDEKEYKEMSLSELINISIDNIENITEERKHTLKGISDVYLKEALEELNEL